MKKVLSIISIFTLLFTCSSVPGRGAGCNTNTKYSFNLSELKRHEFRVFFSDALTLGLSDAFATSLFNALSGTRSDTKSSLMYGIGYRHSLNRFRVYLFQQGYSLFVRICRSRSDPLKVR